MSEAYDDTHLVDPWIALQKRLDPELGDPSRNDRFEYDEAETATISAVANLNQFYPERAYAFALEVARRSKDRWVLATLAVGPIGSLFYNDPGWILPRLREDLARVPRLRDVLLQLPDFNLPPDLDRELSAILSRPG